MRRNIIIAPNHFGGRTNRPEPIAAGHPVRHTAFEIITAGPYIGLEWVVFALFQMGNLLGPLGGPAEGKKHARCI